MQAAVTLAIRAGTRWALSARPAARFQPTKARVLRIYDEAVDFSFLAPLMAIYLVYESWAARPDRATHYLIIARR